MFLPLRMFSQSNVREKEAMIKSSDEYYWAQYTGENQEESRKLSLEALILTIAENTKVDPGVLKVQINGIDYISWPVGPRTKSVAFVRKDEVTKIVKKEMFVVPIEYSEANSSQNSENLQNSSLKKKFGTQSGDSNNENVKKVAEGKGSEQISSVSGHPYNEDTSLIGQLLSIQSLKVLGDWLYSKKTDGSLVYGKKSDFPDSEKKCYIVVFDGIKGNIITVLSPGDDSRTDLKSKKEIQSIEKEYKNMNAIWVQIF